MTSGVYEVLNTTNGKRYIGSAKNFSYRWQAHKKLLRRKKHSNRLLQNAWDKYGETAFSFRPLLVCSVQNVLLYEQLCLDGLRPEYNIRRKAESNLGLKLHDAKSRARISAQHRGHKYNLGRTMSAAAKQRIAAAASTLHKGRPKSEAHRAKLSAALKGRSLPAEHRARIRVALIGNQRAAGAVRSPELRARISASLKLAIAARRAKKPV